jgi:hypothetical protein
VIGPLPVRTLAERVDELGDHIGELAVAGLLSLAFTVDRAGRVRRVRVLSDTTRVPRADERDRVRMVRRITRAIAGWTFGRQRGTSSVTLPIVFERS